jgi:hypothetical protein
MRSILAVLMFATMIQVAQADDEDNTPRPPPNPLGDTATGCITSTTGTVTCL